MLLTQSAQPRLRSLEPIVIKACLLALQGLPSSLLAFDERSCSMALADGVRGVDGLGSCLSVLERHARLGTLASRLSLFARYFGASTSGGGKILRGFALHVERILREVGFEAQRASEAGGPADRAADPADPAGAAGAAGRRTLIRLQHATRGLSDLLVMLGKLCAVADDAAAAAAGAEDEAAGVAGGLSRAEASYAARQWRYFPRGAELLGRLHGLASVQGGARGAALRQLFSHALEPFLCSLRGVARSGISRASPPDADFPDLRHALPAEEARFVTAGVGPRSEAFGVARARMPRFLSAGAVRDVLRISQLLAFLRAADPRLAALATSGEAQRLVLARDGAARSLADKVAVLLSLRDEEEGERARRAARMAEKELRRLRGEDRAAAAREEVRRARASALEERRSAVVERFRALEEAQDRDLREVRAALEGGGGGGGVGGEGGGGAAAGAEGAEGAASEGAGEAPESERPGGRDAEAPRSAEAPPPAAAASPDPSGTPTPTPNPTDTPTGDPTGDPTPTPTPTQPPTPSPNPNPNPHPNPPTLPLAPAAAGAHDAQGAPGDARDLVALLRRGSLSCDARCPALLSPPASSSIEDLLRERRLALEAAAARVLHHGSHLRTLLLAACDTLLSPGGAFLGAFLAALRRLSAPPAALEAACAAAPSCLQDRLAAAAAPPRSAPRFSHVAAVSWRWPERLVLHGELSDSVARLHAAAAAAAHCRAAVAALPLRPRAGAGAGAARALSLLRFRLAHAANAVAAAAAVQLKVLRGELAGLLGAGVLRLGVEGVRAAVGERLRAAEAACFVGGGEEGEDLERQLQAFYEAVEHAAESWRGLEAAPAAQVGAEDVRAVEVLFDGALDRLRATLEAHRPFGSDAVADLLERLY